MQLVANLQQKMSSALKILQYALLTPARAWCIHLHVHGTHAHECACTCLSHLRVYALFECAKWNLNLMNYMGAWIMESLST